LNDPHLYWVGFNLVKGIGAVRFRTLLDFFGSAEMAWQAPADALREAGLSQKLVENLVKVRSQVLLEKVWERMQAQGIQVLTWDDEAYPRRLKEIDQPPPVLYLRGRLIPEDEWAVAIVGTRRITAYGRQVTAGWHAAWTLWPTRPPSRLAGVHWRCWAAEWIASTRPSTNNWPSR
jgi:DNA processing protein